MTCGILKQIHCMVVGETRQLLLNMLPALNLDATPPDSVQSVGASVQPPGVLTLGAIFPNTQPYTDSNTNELVGVNQAGEVQATAIAAGSATVEYTIGLTNGETIIRTARVEVT